MRTTISINDALLDELRRKARERGRTLGEIVEELLRLGLKREQAGAGRFEFPTYGRPGGRAPMPDEIQAILEEEDVERYDQTSRS